MLLVKMSVVVNYLEKNQTLKKQINLHLLSGEVLTPIGYDELMTTPQWWVDRINNESPVTISVNYDSLTIVNTTHISYVEIKEVPNGD